MNVFIYNYYIDIITVHAGLVFRIRDSYLALGILHSSFWGLGQGNIGNYKLVVMFVYIVIHVIWNLYAPMKNN